MHKNNLTEKNEPRSISVEDELFLRPLFKHLYNNVYLTPNIEFCIGAKTKERICNCHNKQI